MMRWYAAYTKPRLELWARSNLWERDIDVYLPQYRKIRRHARRVDEVTVPLFPRYLFVRLDAERTSLRHASTAHGVESLVAFGGKAAWLPDAVIAEIRSREGDDGMIAMDGLEDHFRPGDPLRINAGAFSDQVGLFDGQDDRRRVVLMMTLLGRQVRMKVPLAQVDRVDY